jgi:3-phenylpropionate/cinnamic acid dioxygenase small subunit
MSLDSSRREELLTLVVREARLLDERRYAEWLDLFAEDGRYWIPLGPDQTDPELHTSLVYEDKLLLSMRVERLSGSQAHSQQPPSRSLHVLQQPTLESVVGTTFNTRCAFSYFEARAGEQQVYAAVATHEWVYDASGFRLRSKRVDLLNADAPLPAIQLFM